MMFLCDAVMMLCDAVIMIILGYFKLYFYYIRGMFNNILNLSFIVKNEVQGIFKHNFPINYIPLLYS